MRIAVEIGVPPLVPVGITIGHHLAECVCSLCCVVTCRARRRTGPWRRCRHRRGGRRGFRGRRRRSSCACEVACVELLAVLAQHLFNIVEVVEFLCSVLPCYLQQYFFPSYVGMGKVEEEGKWGVQVACGVRGCC
jgi:hypothetical protein